MGKIKAEKVAKIGKGCSLWRVNGWFHLRCYDGSRTPTTRQQALETRDQDRALQLAQQRFYEWKARAFDPWSESASPARQEHEQRMSTPSLARATEMYIAFQKSEQRTPGTLRATKGRLLHLARHLTEQYQRGAEALPLHDITSEMLRSFIFRPTIKRATQRTLYVTLHAFFRWAVQHNLLEIAPTDTLTKPKMPEPPLDFLTMNQFKQLTLMIEDERQRLKDPTTHRCIWFRHLIVLAVYTGMRRGEIVRLCWGDVHLPTSSDTQGWVTIREAKHGTTGRIPLPPQAVEALQAMHEVRTSEGEQELVFKGAYSGKKLTPSYLTFLFKKYVRKAGFSERLRFHSLRHTYASWLAQHGVRTKTLQELMRHRNIATTMRYMHLSPDHLQQAVQDVFAEPKMLRPKAVGGIPHEQIS